KPTAIAATLNTSCVYSVNSPQRARVGCIAPGSLRLLMATIPRAGAVEHGVRVATLPSVETLLDLLDDAVARFGDQPSLAIRHEDGTTRGWTYRELERHARAAAFRLRSLGLEKGDRILTWSPSTPELPAIYFGAIRAGLVIVPLDLRMSREAIEGIVRTSGAKRLIVGT